MKKAIFIFLSSVTIAIACTKKAVPSTSATAPAKTDVAKTEPAKEPETPKEPTALVQVSEPEKMKIDVLAEQGKNVYIAKCGRCHFLKNTGDFTVERWDEILKSMMPKAKLDANEQNQVIAYVHANAKK